MRKGVFYGGTAIALTAFILFIAIMQNSFNEAPKTVQKDAQKSLEDHRVSEIHITEKDTKDFSKVTTEEVDKDKEENETADEEEEIEISYQTKYVNISSLNVRSGPGVEHESVGVLTINQELEAEDSNGWVSIKMDGLSGYVNSKYLSEEEVVVQTAETNSSEETEDINEEEADNNTNDTETEESNQDSSPQPKNDADKLTTVDENNQLILVTANGYNTSSATVQTFERDCTGDWQQVLEVSGFIGMNGFADNKVEGDGKSPTGKYSIGTAFGRSGNPGTKLQYREITPDDVWVDDPDSPLYNTWQSKEKTSDQWNSAEDMDIALYTHGFVINYNTAQTPGKGSAIFFHIANGHTLGCTGVSEGNMVSILQWLDPAENPVIIQTPVSELGRY